MSKVCSIFFYEGYVGIAPTIINLSQMLSQNYGAVTIYGTENYYPNPGHLGEGVKTIYFSKNSSAFYKLSSRLKINSIGPLLLYIFQCLAYSFKHDHPAQQEKKVNIGVDIYGNIVALLYFILFRQPFLFLSLELINPQQYRWFSGVELLARLAYRKAAGVIIQDPDRFQIMGRYYGYEHPNVFYLPNSPLNQPSLPEKPGNYFREHLNLSPEQFPHLLMQAGMISDDVCSTALAQGFASVDSGIALIFHSSKKRSPEDPYIKSLIAANSKNLFLSLEPLPYEEIDKIYAATTLGLAFYAERDSNFTEISMASGKLPQYLKWGKPVLVSDLPSLSKLVEQYQCGIAIANPADGQEIQAALERILSDYDTYSKNARACFEAEFDFAKKMEPVLKLMNSV